MISIRDFLILNLDTKYIVVIGDNLIYKITHDTKNYWSF